MTLSQEQKRAKWREEYRRYHPVKPAQTFYHPTLGRIVVHDHCATRIFWSQQMLQYLRQNYATMLNSELAEWLGVSMRTMIRKARELGLQKDTTWLKGVWDERRRMAIASNRINGNSGYIKKGQHLNPSTEFKKKQTS